MKRRNHNADLKKRLRQAEPALEEAAALLVRAIAAQLKRPQSPTPEKPRRDRFASDKSVPPTSAPATREETVKIGARLFTLGLACSDLSLPLQVAAAWLPLSEIATFADRAEEHIRALINLFDETLAAHPSALQERGAASTGFITRGDLNGAKKQIARLARIANGSIGLDIGPLYLPPECRPEGFVENWPPLRDPHEAEAADADPDPDETEP